MSNFAEIILAKITKWFIDDIAGVLYAIATDAIKDILSAVCANVSYPVRDRKFVNRGFSRRLPREMLVADGLEMTKTRQHKITSWKPKLQLGNSDRPWFPS